MSVLRYPPSQNGLQKSLASALNTGVTASMTLNNTTNVQNKPGVCVLDRIDSGGTLKSTSVREYVAYAGTSGATLTTLTRNVDNSSSDQDHAIGAVVEFIPDVTWGQAVIDALANLVNTTTLAVDPTKIPIVSGGFSTTLTTTATTNVTLPTTGTLATKAGSETLTNKTIDYNSNTIQNLPSGAVDGWTAVSGSWTYASASTITVPSGAASLYQKGDRIKWTQTTVKYGVIIAVADTVLTIAINTDYVVTNADISAISYSHQANPVGYPTWFAYTTTITPGGSLTYGTVTQNCKFAVIGSTCIWRFYTTGTFGGSAAPNIIITNPITSLATNASMGTGASFFITGTSQLAASVVYLNATQFQLARYDYGNFPTSGTGQFSFSHSYEI